MYANSRAVAGTSAYDLERIGAIPELPYGARPGAIPREEERVRVKEREAVRTRTRTRVRADRRQGIAPAAVLGYLGVGFLMVLVLLSYVQLTTVSTEAVRLESELTSLQQEGATLAVAHESAFNLVEIEAYAKGVLGMMEPATGQIYFIESSQTDQAVILTPEAADDSLLGAVRDFLLLLQE